MLYTILEVSEKINLSKVSIYKKLKSDELKVHITKKKGVSYIDEEGFNLIRDSLKTEKTKESNTTSKQETAADSDTINLKLDYINYLKQQIKTKDQLILKISDLLEKALKLNENNQVLLKDKPKLIEEPKKGFWAKLFESS